MTPREQARERAKRKFVKFEVVIEVDRAKLHEAQKTKAVYQDKRQRWAEMEWLLCALDAMSEDGCVVQGVDGYTVLPTVWMGNKPTSFVQPNLRKRKAKLDGAVK